MTSPRALRPAVAACVCTLVLAAFGGEAGGAAAASPPEEASRVVAHRAGGREVARPVLPSVETWSIGHAAAEPTLGVASNGDVFYAAADTARNLSVDVMRSRDRGRSWEIVSPRLAGQNVHATTGDPYVYVDRTDAGSRVFTVDLQGFACSLLSFSDDAGESWTTNPLGCGRPVNDHQTVFAGPPVESTTLGYPNVVYYCYHDVMSSACSKSLDGGVTFVPTGGTSFSGFDEDGTTLCGGLHGHGFAGPDGTIYIPKGHCGMPWLAISQDEGATWTRVQVADLPSAGHEASVAADARGNVYYGYIGSDKLPYLVVSRDGGLTWETPMMVGRPGVVEASLPSLDVGSSGLVAFGYMGTRDLPEPDYSKVAWDGYVTTTRNALARRPLFYSVSVNDRGDPLLRGTCPQSKCGPVYDFVDVVVAPDDTVWGAFVDGCITVCEETGAANDGSNGLATEIRVPR